MIVVTGSSGFIGSGLVQRLVDDGHHVVGIDRRPPTHPPAPSPIGKIGRFVALDAELSMPDDRVIEALTGAAAVVHLAACPGVRDASADIEHRRHRDNVVATEAVLSGTPSATPLVVASSSSVYGGTTHGRASREGDVLRPVGGYARSKLTAEHRCRRARAERGGHVTVVRPFTVVGPGQRPDMALARWIDRARRGEPLPVYGRLGRKRDVTDVRDVVRALAALIGLGPTTLNIGTGRARTLGELVAAVQLVHGPCRIDHLDSPVWEPDETCADTVRFERLLGFRPVTDLRDVVEAQSERSRSAA